LGVREQPQQFSDEHLASEIGSLYVQGIITLIEYEAGLRYGKVILEYLKTIDAPAPYSSERCESYDDDTALKRKVNMAAARQVLKSLNNPKCARIVDRVTVYGEPVYADDIPVLRTGLRALAGN